MPVRHSSFASYIYEYKQLMKPERSGVDSVISAIHSLIFNAAVPKIWIRNGTSVTQICSSIPMQKASIIIRLAKWLIRNTDRFRFLIPMALNSCDTARVVKA